MASKYIVTGAAGFIGSTISERLLEQGHTVVGVDCLTDYYAVKLKEENLRALEAHDHFTFLKTDILQAPWAELLDGAAGVFHQAAQAGVRASWGKHFGEYTERNILATQHLLEAMKGTSVRMVFASSSSVYGDTKLLPMSEEHTPKPHSPYGVTKLAAEHLCGLYSRNFGVDTVALRYFTVYGPRQRPDMAFHRFIRAGLTGEKITLYGDGEQTRDFTFVEDIVAANLAALEKGASGGVYNIGGGSRITVNKVLDTIGGILGKPLKVERQDVQKGDVRDTFADASRARADLGFAPSTSVADGLAREAAWVENSLPLLV